MRTITTEDVANHPELEPYLGKSLSVDEINDIVNGKEVATDESATESKKGKK